MSTLIFTYGYPPSYGGVQAYTEGVAKGLWKQGENIVVLAPYYDGCKSSDSQRPFPIYRGPSKLLIRELWMLAVLPWLIKKYDVTRILNTVWLPCGLISWMVTRFIKIPYYLSAHGSEILDTQNIKNHFKHQLRKRLRLLKLITFKNADVVFAVSKYTKQLIISQGISSDNICVVPNGVDTSRFYPTMDDAGIRIRHGLGDCKIILTISRLDDYKGHDTVIRAMPRVLSSIPNVVYLIVGKGPEMNNLKEMAKNLGISNKVVFTGYVPDEELIYYYNICNFFIMVSRVDEKDVEGFGLVYLESNACGKPVIGGDSGGVCDAVIDGYTGVVVDPLNINDITEAIIRLLRDRDEARRLARNGLNRAKNELDWMHVTKRMRGIMNREI